MLEEKEKWIRETRLEREREGEGSLISIQRSMVSKFSGLDCCIVAPVSTSLIA